MKFAIVTAAALAGAASLAACSDAADSIAAPRGSALAAAAPGAAHAGIPTRSQERPGTFVDMSDAELWPVIEASNGVAVVGVKAPGAPRGVYQGRRLVTPGQTSEARRAVLAQAGVALVSEDNVMPTVTVRLDGPEALARVRRLPVVDYVEPIRTRSEGMPYWASGGSGCTGNAWTGGISTIAPGDVLPGTYLHSGIEKAWARGVTGAGVTVGLSDTGIFREQTSLSTHDGFNAGMSGGRTLALWMATDYPDPFDQCNHGTRMAGVIAGPRDGIGILGVAWRANLVSVRHGDGVVMVDNDDGRQSIRFSVDRGARIVSLAWQANNWFWYISDEIERLHAQGILFVGAAGTSNSCSTPITDRENVVFPAEMEQVVAVTGLDASGNVACDVHFGAEVDLATVIVQPSPGRNPHDLISLGGSSNATAIVAGIAALVWSEYPWMTRTQVVTRMLNSTNRAYRSGQIGWGLINAYKAVGGYTGLSIGAPAQANPNSSVTVTARPSGDGPFTYQWSNGATTASTTYPAGALGTTVTVQVTVTDTRENLSRTSTRTIPVEYPEPEYEEPTCLTAAPTGGEGEAMLPPPGGGC